MSDPIAQLTIYGKRLENVRRFKIRIEIGAPYPYEEGLWRCDASLRPLLPRLAPMTSESSFQSLCLAMSLVQYLLDNFRDEGGKLTLKNGEEFPLEAYSFGIAKRPASSDSHA